MNTNELLYPRYKVIAPWPGMEAEPFRLEQIVTLRPHKDDEGECFIHIPDKHMPGSYMRRGFFDKFPHLFKKLEWWEERKIEEMPEYIKFTNSGRVFKISKWSKCIGGWNMHNEVDGKDVTDCYASIEWHFQKEKSAPATLAEYEQYINQKENDE